MATQTLPEEIADGQTGSAGRVMSNFRALLNAINSDVVHRDGSRALSGHLDAPAVPITSPTQLAPKSYVDAAIAAVNKAWASWTPVITQGVTLTHSTSIARSKVVDESALILQMFVTFTSAGTSGAPITVGGLPLDPINGFEFAVGSFDYFDSGTGFYDGTVLLTTDDKLVFRLGGTNGGGSYALGTAFAVAAADFLSFTVTIAL